MILESEGLLTPNDIRLKTDDGLELSAWSWNAHSRVGWLVVGHGLGEHAGLYETMAMALAIALDLSILAFDFRGHGRSPGRRGYVQDYRHYLHDWKAAMRWAGAHSQGRPVYALGHSNGGLAALLAEVEGHLPSAGLIVSNPALRVKMPVPAVKLALGHTLRLVAPRVTLQGRIPLEDLTRDPLQQSIRKHDRLMHARISAPLFFGMRSAADQIERAVAKVQQPVLMILGGADPIIDPEANRRFFDRIPATDKTLLVFDEMRHEPLAELGRERVLREITLWLKARLERGAVSNLEPPAEQGP